MNETRILVVDDEPQITRVLRRSLSSKGYEVQVAEDGEEALDVFRKWNPDIVITDLFMPRMGGLELTRRIRKTSQVPILILSVKGEERAKVEALDTGADDYLTKPFGMDELFARIRVALRRSSLPANNETSTIELGDFTIDQNAHIVKIRGKEIHLTPKEYDLLLYFLQNPGRVLTHRTLLGAVWGGESVEQNEYLRVFIGQLRKKIEMDPAKPQYIVTEPWIGYRFIPELAG
ncbi:response regulator transcription factor [bacterium]|nr:response regulator transcription factor [bacterium]MCI0614473.1 response regulator transcription factor [bacterium]